MVGTLLSNRYRIDAELGRGGMGVVYRAHDTLLDRPVAVKVLNDSGLGTEGKARLLAEARAAAKLNHPNIVSVHDAGEADGSPFIVMELVEGESLREAAALPLAEALAIARQICAALEHAHASGIIHRDLKPENVVLTRTHTAKLMDFGLARIAGAPRLTEEGALVGTFSYLAPELIAGGGPSAQSDLYSLGVMVYELVAGRPPFEADTLMAVLAQHVHAPVVPPSAHNPEVPAWLDELITQLLSKRPEERPASAGEVRQRLSPADLMTDVTDGSGAFAAREAAKHPLAPNNLPTHLSKFIGREREIAHLKQRLAECRLITLTGSGGVGKTRLAIQVARELLPGYPDGAWLVELAPLADPALVPQAVVTVLGVRDESGRPLLTVLADYLRGKALLLILDNCEHVIDACAQLAGQLLTQCPDVRLVASSREALGIEGEVAFRVPSLSLPPAEGATREALADSEAVQLFVERAVAALSGFALTDANAPAIAQVCRRLDGVALAIELAASRVKLLKVEQIATRLDDAFRLLTGGSRTALPRQQTLQATIDWSYRLLSEAERRLLCRLSVFAGGWTLEAAEAVCAGEGIESYEILDLLTQLVNKSLVTAEREQGEEARYRLLETVRQYARGKLLESGESQTLRERHLAYFLEFAERAEPELYRRDQAAWLERLETEHDNLRAALEWSSQAQPGASLRMSGALTEFWDTRGHFTEGRQWLERSLTATAHVQTPDRVKALYGATGLAARQSDVQRTLALLDEGLALSRRLDYKTGLAQGVSFSSVAAEWQGESRERVEALQNESLTLWREVGDKRGIGQALGPHAARALKRCDFGEATRLFSESLSLFREVGDEREIAGALWNLAEVAIMTGNTTQSCDRAEESLALYRKLSDKHGIATVLRTLGEVAHNQGNDAHAQAQYEASEALFRELGDRDCRALTLCGLGQVEHSRRNPQRATALGEESLAVFRDAGDRGSMTLALNLLGRAVLALGDEPRARQFFAEGLTVQREMGDKRGLASLLEGLAGAVIAGEQPQLLRAARLSGAAEALRESIATPLGPVERADYDRNLAATRSALGEEAFASAWAEGRAMTMEQAIAFALGEAEV